MGASDYRTDEAILNELGARLGRERLRRNLTQEALADAAGVSRATVRRMEAGHSTQLANLIRVLRALGLLGNIQLLVPEPIASPIEQLERAGKPRQRASSPARTTTDEKRAGSQKSAPWSWGEDR